MSDQGQNTKTGSEAELNLRYQILPFEKLSRDEIYEILWLRNLVFVVGQGITSELEVDGRDRNCDHVLVYAGGEYHEQDTNGCAVIATARIFAKLDPLVIGRICVHPCLQGRGVGSWMMKQIQNVLEDRSAELHAQAHLEPWYRELGWQRVGDTYLEAQIPHVTMVWLPEQ